MADDVKPEVIKRTQDLLGKYFKKPPLTEKLLKKPPFRFLHDIISAVIQETGFLEGLFTEEELHSENIKDKDAKLAYLTKLIDVVKIISGNNLMVRASKIISGQEATKTNELLQAIGKALDKNLNSTEAIEQYKKGSEKKVKAKTRSKITTKEGDVKPASRQSSQTRKPADKEKQLSVQQKRSSSTGKVVTKSKEEFNERVHDNKKYNSFEHENNENSIEKRNDIIDIPPAEPIQDKISQKRKSSFAKSEENVNISTDLQSNISMPANISTDKKPEKETSKTKQIVQNEEIKFEDSIKGTSELLIKPKSVETIDRNVKKSVNEITVETTNEHQKDNGKVISTPPGLHSQKSEEGQSIQQFNDVPRPRTSLRPPTVRPSSARPAAPKMKARNELVINEEISTPMGNINVIIEHLGAKEDDDAEDMVVMERRESIGSSLETNSNYQADSQLTQEHGHLVAQILETQRELINTDNVDLMPKKVDITWEAGTKREREVATKEIDKLRSTIQTLTRATNPLGKLLDYLQEDIETMQKELLNWKHQHSQLSEELEKERMRTEEVIEPMKMSLTEIDNNIRDQSNKIYQTKARILKNNQKIQRLLNGDL